MATVVELRPRAKEDFTSSLGMIIFLGSWAMMFCALFFAYGFARARAVDWPPAGMPKLPILLPGFNTLVLLGSSATFIRGLKELRRGDKRAFTFMVGATMALGLLFLALQVTVWRQLADAGLHVTSGIYGSVVYALTTLHAAHVAVGLIVLLVVLIRALRGRYTEHNHINVRLCAMFWHFVDVVWVLMFVSLYLV